MAGYGEWLSNPQTSQTLLALGAGLLGSAPTTGDRWRQGLLGANQAMQQGQENEMRRQMFELQKAQMSMPRPEDIVAVMGPDGNPVYVPKSQAVGMAPMPKSPLVQIDTGSQKFEEERRKSDAARLSGQIELSDEMSKGVDAANQLRALIVDEGFTPGKTAGVRGDAAGFVSDIGGLLGLGDAAAVQSAEDLAGKTEQYRQISNNIALGMKAGMTGAMSDSDRQFLQEQAPLISDTREGALRKVEIINRLHERERQKAIEMQEWADQRGSLRGFDEYWQQKASQQNLFGDMYQQPQGQGGRAPQYKIQPPPQAIEDLRRNPETAPYFIETFGALPEGF